MSIQNKILGLLFLFAFLFFKETASANSTDVCALEDALYFAVVTPADSVLHDKTLALTLSSPFLNGVQKILEGNQCLGPAAIVGDASALLKMARSFYKMQGSNPSNHTSLYSDILTDASLLGANYFLYRGFQDKSGMERVYYSLFKAPSVLNSELKKIQKKNIPIFFLSKEGVEFMRHSSLFCAEFANLFFKHYKYNSAVTAVIAYRAANHAYECANEYNSQGEFTLTPSMFRNIVIGVVLATQVPLQYSMRFGFLGVFLTFEYILNAYLTYDRA